LFWSLFLCLWRWNGFLRDLISILPISWMPAIRIIEHRREPHVCSFYDTKNKKNINYFVWWIIWHFTRTDISLNLSKLTNDALYFLLLLFTTATLTLLTKTSTIGSKICTNTTDSSKCKHDLQIMNLRCLDT